MARRKGSAEKPAAKAVTAGWRMALSHPLFAPFELWIRYRYPAGEEFPDDGWATLSSTGTITVHPTRLAKPEEWAYVFAHCILHLGFGHLQTREKAREWNLACDCYVTRFLKELKFGKAPAGMDHPLDFVIKDEESFYLKLVASGVKQQHEGFGTAGRTPDLLVGEHTEDYYHSSLKDWSELLSEGLRNAVGSAVRVAGGYQNSLSDQTAKNTNAARAREWFINSYPMLGALAASFTIIEDVEICRRLDIAVAAVDSESKEVFMNPHAGLSEEECRFVMAHELLHVGLRHQSRRAGRDPYLWNVACDYVINGWLKEMGVGEFPRLGGLLDSTLKGLSAEALYDRIVTDLRTYRKLATFRGVGGCDMLERGDPDWWNTPEGTSLDEFYRNCLTQGLIYHHAEGRGFIPAGLIEEIRALSQPPIPWDVELARWFDVHITPLERTRTYARLSRRQSSTPDIPRPVYHIDPELQAGRTFGVVLDTSGSMDRTLLAKTLGAIASYSQARDVPAVRVVFCDADYYDQGYLPTEEIAGRVKVKGRGGTVLQPAISFLETEKDFPPNAPILIITDGYCERLRVNREHAYLMPAGKHLPFVAKGPVFRVS